MFFLNKLYVPLNKIKNYYVTRYTVSFETPCTFVFLIQFLPWSERQFVCLVLEMTRRLVIGSYFSNPNWQFNHNLLLLNHVFLLLLWLGWSAVVEHEATKARACHEQCDLSSRTCLDGQKIQDLSIGYRARPVRDYV